MKKFSIRISDETYNFINETAQKNETTMSELCNSIIEKYRDGVKSFEKNILHEITLNTAVLQKILNQTLELNKLSNAQLLFQRMSSKESSKAGFLAKTRFEEFEEDANEGKRLLKKMDEYVEENDNHLVKILKKMEVI